MIVAICGYNASGKTTVASKLEADLASRGFEVEIRRFAALYPGTYIGKKKQKRAPKVARSGNVGLRAIEGQRGEWNQKLGWSTFANLVAASFAARWVSLVNRRRVIIFDRFIHDRCIHFSEDDRLLRIAKRFFYAPAVTLVLQPSVETHEKRFLDRIQRRHGIELERMSDDDRAELAMVHGRYANLLNEFPECVLVDTGDPESVRRACAIVENSLPGPT